MKLEVQHISFQYHKNQSIINDISFITNTNEVICLIGKNGSGKSTLLKCIDNILTPIAGQILLDDVPIKNIKKNEFAQHVSYVPQTQNMISRTVFDTILMGRLPYINYAATKTDLEITSQIITDLGLQDVALKNVLELSGGMQQLVLLGRSLATRSKIILLDEITSSLDIKNQVEIMQLIKEIATKYNTTIIMTIHDLNLAFKYVNHFIILKDGKIIYDGHKDNITCDIIKKAFEIDAEIQKINNNYYIITKEANDEKI